MNVTGTEGAIFTACVSRQCFVWLTHRQTAEGVIAGHEAAWEFIGAMSRR
jgi:hypothetical protein